MSLFYVSVWEKNSTENESPFWEHSVDAKDVEEAYQIGKSQFVTENLGVDIDDYIVKASGY